MPPKPFWCEIYAEDIERAREFSSDAGSFLIIADPEGTPLGLWCP
ncbi:VOC family protein [Nesterenkonia muleiensis]|nr:hypothetical protein [Nesterenkonia muleiensis]